MSLTWPVVARISQKYATNPNNIQPNGHTGIDFAVPLNTPIKAAGAGTVVYADWATKLSASNKWLIAPAYAGIVVVIDHGNGLLSLYAHLNKTALNIGNRVTQGQTIGLSGSTGLSSGPHLHFEIIGWPLKPTNGFYGRLDPNKYVFSVAPAASLGANQRKVGADNVNMRSAANSGGKVLRLIKAGTVETFTGYVIGQSVKGINVWYKDAQGYAWAGGFTSQSTTGLKNLTPAPAPAPKPTPAPVPVPVPVPVPTPVPVPYKFTPDFDFVEYKPAALPNLQIGNFPAKPEYVVIHQFGTLGVDTLGSTINTFSNPNNERQSSAHFVVSGKRIIQMVSLKDRAYHAGAVGNNYIGIETDPAQDADTIASTKKLLAALKAKYGYELKKTLHRDVSGNSTNCGASITLSKYDLDVVPSPAPVPQPVPTPVPVDEEAIIDAFLASMKKAYFDQKK